MPSQSNALIEDHKDRLKGLEDDVTEIKVTTALATQSVANVMAKLDDGFRGLNEKLEDRHQQITRRLDEGAQRFEAHADELKKHEQEIAGIKKIEAARNARWGVAKKAILPLLAGAAGVVATKSGEGAWSWLVKLLG